MTYIPTFGIEIEMGRVSYNTFARKLRERGINGFNAVHDASLHVDAEVVTCPLAPCQTAWEYIQNLTAAINAIGREEIGNSDRLINDGCGLHVHIGNAFLNDGVDPDEYTRKSIAAFGTTGASTHLDHADPMDFEQYRDFIWRYARMQSTIDSMMYPSRRNNRFCYPLTPVVQKIERATDRNELASALRDADIDHRSKFSAITLQTWGKGTIEFRQHGGTTDAQKIRRWVEFLLNLVNHRVTNRVEANGTRTIVHDTPVDPFRRNSRVGVQYTMMRNADGATTRQIMDATGCSEQRVRAAVSEIRTRVGDAAVVTHTQQANGASYGDGTDHTRYQVLQRYETEAAGAQLLPENRRGVESVWAGINDDHFAWWQDWMQRRAR